MYQGNRIPPSRIPRIWHPPNVEYMCYMYGGYGQVGWVVKIMHIGVEGGQNFLSRLSKSSSDLLVLHLSDIVILITEIHETMSSYVHAFMRMYSIMNSFAW